MLTWFEWGILKRDIIVGLISWRNEQYGTFSMTPTRRESVGWMSNWLRSYSLYYERYRKRFDNYRSNAVLSVIWPVFLRIVQTFFICNLEYPSCIIVEMCACCACCFDSSEILCGDEWQHWNYNKIGFQVTISKGKRIVWLRRQKQVSQSRLVNTFHSILWDPITYPCLRYLLLVPLKGIKMLGYGMDVLILDRNCVRCMSTGV